jgi:AcrR family transcriptional regulator
MGPATSKNSPRFDRTSGAILDAAARVFAEDATANLATVAAAAGISRATLYRYYDNREALLDALSADAVADAVRRLADAGLDRVPVGAAVERIMRALVAVGDRVAVLLSHHATLKAAHEQLAPPIQRVFARGVETGVLRDDLSVDILWTFFAGTAVTAVKLAQHDQLGLEEASAVAASVFLNGARPPTDG